MRTSLALVSLALAVLLASAQAYDYTETHGVGEPWSGWYWPMYDCGPDGGPYMWQGGVYGGDSGPIYDLDTRYFWRDGAARDRAQVWEYLWHRTTQYDWWGHCWGYSCAAALEDDPPSDCGALSRDDLEGLLSELYSWCAFIDLGNGEPEIRPSDMWLALQRCMIPWSPDWGRIVVDFSRVVDANNKAQVWNWPVYMYKVEYNLSGPNSDLATGEMTLYYEDHQYNTEYAPDYAKYGFSCKMDGVNHPRRGTGSWTSILRSPRNIPTPPDWASRPTARHEVYDWDYHSTNYYLWQPEETLDIRRVIEHKTIILDDAFGSRVCPADSGWVRRPGYADSCWAGPGDEYTPHCQMYWLRSGPIGNWDIYIYKTQPYGQDVMDTTSYVLALGRGYHANQGSPPFNDWKYMYTSHSDSGYLDVAIFGWNAQPLPSMVYFDAFKLEWRGNGLDGGATAAAAELGGDGTRVRVTPNPVRRTALISYVAPSPGRVDAAVYDVTGRAVLRAPQDVERPGLQTATISVAGLPSGTYIARVTAEGVNTTCRFVVCR